MAAFVVGLQLGFTERPAAMGHPWSRFKVEILERTAPAAPAIAAAAEEAAAAAVGESVGETDIFSAIEVTRRVVCAVATALKKAGTNACPVELTRDRYSGSSATDDANLGLDNRAFVDASRVDKHLTVQCCMFSSAGDGGPIVRSYAECV